MIKVYRKTATIKAEQFDGSEEMVDKYHVRCDTQYMLSDDPIEYTTVPYQMETLEGFLNINAGDWIATGADGSHWIIPNALYEQQYGELPVIPKAVADWVEKCKHDGIAIASAMDERQLNKKVSDYFKTYYTRDQWIKLQDDFARAWLDGYVVEEEK